MTQALGEAILTPLEREDVPLILTLRIPDDLYQAYSERGTKKPQEELERTLLAFKDVDPRDARVILSGETLREISKILGHPISTAKELLEHLTRSQRVAFPEDGVEVALNVGQRQRLKAQADFFTKVGKATPEEYANFVKKQVEAGVVMVVGP